MQRKFIVTGREGKALYDFEKGKVFSISEKEAEELKQFCYDKENLLQFLKGNKEIRFKHINFELTARCNLKCKHCYGGEDFGKKQKELSTEEWRRIIKEIAEFKPKFLLFTGGEALLREDFNELLRFTNAFGIKTSVFSNLTLLSEENALALKETNSVVQFSSYGDNAELHDSVTGVKGSFGKQQKALEKLKEMGVKCRGQIILMKDNIAVQKNIEKFFKEKGIEIEFSISRPSGRQKAEGIPGCATCSFPEGYLKVKGKKVSVNFDFFVMKHFYNNCWIQRCGVTAEGKVLACVFARNKVLGDLKKQSFSEIYEKIKENAAEYKCDGIENCKNCLLRYACVDCRPWAHSITGNWKEKNPYCKI